MSEIIIDVKNFNERVSLIRKHVSMPLFVILGKSEDVEISNLNSAIFLYLLKYEFPETIIIISKEDVTIITSQKKAMMLEALKSSFKIFVRKKDNSNVDEVKSEIKKFGDRLGVADKENIKGNFSDCFMKIEDVIFEDITRQVLHIFQVKSKAEIDKSWKAGLCSQFFVERCVELILKEQSDMKRITHNEVSQKIEDLLYDNDIKLPVSQEKIEFTYPPFLQSGNIFDLHNLHINPTGNTYVKYDNILVKIGVRYEGYCAEKGITILFNPEQSILDDVNCLYEIQEAVVKAIKPKVSVSSVQDMIRELFVKKKIGSRINKDIIYSTGLYQQEELLKEAFEEGMVLVIKLEIKNELKVLNLIDTFYLSDELKPITQNNIVEADKKEKHNLGIDLNKPIIIRTDKKMIGIRVRKRDQDLEKNIRRAEHQKELLDKLIEEMKNHYRENKFSEKEVKDENKVYIPYKKETLVMRKPKMAVDIKAEALIIPIFDYCVPFHISMIKNLSKTDNNDFSTIRINFNQKEILKSAKGEKNLDSLKSISYIGANNFIEDIFKQILDLKKSFQENLNTQIQNQNLVEQEALIESKDKRVVLTDVFMKTDARTGLKKGKASNLELHENGFRFPSQSVEILFSNIKNIFYQEATIDQRAILHFHLINHLIIGKKTLNVQFYKEVGMNTAHDTIKNRNDEYMEMVLEKEFEEKKNLVNKEFKMFVEKIEESHPIRIEIPYLDRGFYGVPFRESILINPTNECLVSIYESPFFVVNLNEIEIVNFERVVYGVKTSDLVIVLRDKKKPPISVLSIESSCIPSLKDFFDSKNVIFLETKINIQWPNLIKTIMVDPLSFYENNAWYDLINPDVEEDTESVTDVDTEYTSVESSFNTDDETEDASEDFEGEDEISDEEDYYASENNSFVESSEDYDYSSKRRK